MVNVCWMITRLDGSTTEVKTVERMTPTPGDGKIVNKIPVKVGSQVTTPVTSPLTGCDVVVAAKEQKL